MNITWANYMHVTGTQIGNPIVRNWVVVATKLAISFRTDFWLSLQFTDFSFNSQYPLSVYTKEILENNLYVVKCNLDDFDYE